MEHQRNGHKPHSIFVDSDAFIASLKRDDPNHHRAKHLFETLENEPVHFVTSHYVFAETVTVLSQRINRHAALNYIETMTSEETPFSLMWSDEMIVEEAIAIFEQQTSKNTSFVDCTNIAFIRLFHLDSIFSFDEVYRKNDIKMLTETAK